MRKLEIEVVVIRDKDDFVETNVPAPLEPTIEDKDLVQAYIDANAITHMERGYLDRSRTTLIYYSSGVSILLLVNINLLRSAIRKRRQQANPFYKFKTLLKCYSQKLKKLYRKRSFTTSGTLIMIVSLSWQSCTPAW